MHNDGFIKFVNKYKWNSVLLRTVLISFVFIFVPIILIGSTLFLHNLQNSKKQIVSFANDSHNQIQNTWKNVNDTIYNMHMLTTSQSLLNDFLYMPPYENSQEQTQSFIAISAILRNSIATSNYINSAYLYNKSTHYILSSSGGCDEKMFWDTGWIDKIDENDYYGFVRDISNGGSQSKYITVIKPFFGFENCFAIYNIDYYELLSSISASYTTAKRIYIISPDKRIVFSLNDNDLGQEAQSIEQISNSSGGDLNISGTDEYGYTLITLAENKSDMTLKNYSVIILTLMLLLLVLSLFASFYITSNFYRSIKSIILQIPQDIIPFSEKQPTNEFNFITSAVSSLVKENSEFEQELTLQLTKIKNAQLIALQEQINPHFIFNTLNIISLLDLQNSKSNHSISKVTGVLSDILRYILSTGKYLVPLGEELKYLEKYIELQSIRYDGKFKTEWHIEPKTETLYVVKFSLQPIVENAIMHGFAKKDENNRILIKSSLANDYLKIEITNNGALIEPSKIAEIQNRLNSENDIFSDHIGLFNTNMRYNLLFGKSYSCTVNSNNVSGTTVTLLIPKTDTL